MFTFIVDLAVSINISLSNHLVHLLISQLLPQVGHHVTQLGGADEAVAVLVEHPEGFSDLFLARMEIFVTRVSDCERCGKWSPVFPTVTGFETFIKAFNYVANEARIR